MKKTITLGIVLVLLLACVGAVSANLVANGNFEDPALVPDLIKLLGKNIFIQMGGGIHGHPYGTKAGAKAARQAIDAVMQNKSLKEYSKNHKELKLALEHFK